MREAALQDLIRIELGDPSRYPDLTLWRNACGFDAANRQRYGIGNPGGADLIGLYAGRFCGLEIKTQRGQQSDEQRKFEQLVKSKGGVYVVVRSVEEAREWAENMRSGK